LLARLAIGIDNQYLRSWTRYPNDPAGNPQRKGIATNLKLDRHPELVIKPGDEPIGCEQPKAITGGKVDGLLAN
jgi:hypothetical protein